MSIKGKPRIPDGVKFYRYKSKKTDSRPVPAKITKRPIPKEKPRPFIEEGEKKNG